MINPTIPNIHQIIFDGFFFLTLAIFSSAVSFLFLVIFFLLVLFSVSEFSESLLTCLLVITFENFELISFEKTVGNLIVCELPNTSFVFTFITNEFCSSPFEMMVLFRPTVLNVTGNLLQKVTDIVGVFPIMVFSFLS